MKTRMVGAFEAKTHLSELLEEVRQGKTFHITRRGHPVAELRPLPATGRKARFGCDKDRISIAADFDDPVPGMEDYTR